MQLSDIRCAMVLAQTEHVGQAAAELNVNPGTISKSLRRLEQSVGTRLFDRVGRNIRINQTGREFVRNCGPVLAELEQIRSGMLGRKHPVVCRIAGPALLQLHFGIRVSDILLSRYPEGHVTLRDDGEADGIAALRAGDADLALATQLAVDAQWPDLATQRLGQTRFAVAIGDNHPLAGSRPVAVDRLLTHDFAAPVRPAFRALEDAVATDGWRDDAFPRVIRFRTADMLALIGLVKSGRALAYLPRFVIDDAGLNAMEVRGCPYQCDLDIVALYQPTRAHGWLNWLAGSLVATPGASTGT